MLMDSRKLRGLHLRRQSVAIRLILRQISEAVLPAEWAFVERSDCVQSALKVGDIEGLASGLQLLGRR